MEFRVMSIISRNNNTSIDKCVPRRGDTVLMNERFHWKLPHELRDRTIELQEEGVFELSTNW